MHRVRNRVLLSNFFKLFAGLLLVFRTRPLLFPVAGSCGIPIAPAETLNLYALSKRNAVRHKIIQKFVVVKNMIRKLGSKIPLIIDNGLPLAIHCVIA